jgi:phospholipid-translocating ATPase
MAVHSDTWQQHLIDVRAYLLVMQRAGFTLGIKKCEFAKPQLKYIGHLIGSGERRVDPAKTDKVQGLREPETKKQIRKLLGFFSFFSEYIPNYSMYAKPLTDLTGKRMPERIILGQLARSALQTLKDLLCNATFEPLFIIDPSKPFSLYVDSCDYAVGAILTQTREADNAGPARLDYPVAFASAKLTETQQRWAIIEKEAYSALWGLQKFKHWLFGTVVTLYSDHNPITFLTETTPKSSKLVRWSLALAEFNVVFRYRHVIENEAAACMSRMIYSLKN